MKRALYLVLKSTESAFHTLEELKRDGYNATIMSTESLRHVVDDNPEEHHFYSLRHYEQNELSQSFLCLFVVEEKDANNLKASIRRLTDNFKSVKGFMFSKAIEDFEGSIQ